MTLGQVERGVCPGMYEVYWTGIAVLYELGIWDRTKSINGAILVEKRKRKRGTCKRGLGGEKKKGVTVFLYAATIFDHERCYDLPFGTHYRLLLHRLGEVTDAWTKLKDIRLPRISRPEYSEMGCPNRTRSKGGL